MDESVALCNPKLSLFADDLAGSDEYVDRPQHKITNFRYALQHCAALLAECTKHYDNFDAK